MGAITIHEIRLLNVEPKTGKGKLQVSYVKNNIQETIQNECVLKEPALIVNELLLKIKSKDKIIFYDVSTPEELLERYSPINIDNEEEVEEKMFHFIKMICEKAKSLKTTRDAKEYMRIINEFKTLMIKL